MALTLVESSKIALGQDQVLKATIMELYARASDVLQYMPFDNITGNSMAFNREENLPGVGFRGVNEAYTESVGSVDKIVESLAIAGGDLDVDKFLVDTGGPDQRSSQEAMKVKALSLSITRTIVKGDVLTTRRAFDGLQVRCTGDQLIGNRSSIATGISIASLDETIDAVDEPTHLIMSKDIRRRLTTGARDPNIGGYIVYDLDAFGRRVTKYNDLPILIADKDETNTEILGFTETSSGGTAATATSVYCVSFAPNGVMGLQNGDMDVRNLGELDTQPVFRTRVEWYLTLAILRERAAARLYSIPRSPAQA